jgi:hypothetical protein
MLPRDYWLDRIYAEAYNYGVAWEVEYTDEFGEWWDDLDEDAQEDSYSVVGLLIELGPALGFPHSSDVKGSRYGQMRELRIQSNGRPFRILYAFDPRRTAILLVGGDKTGDRRWYEKFVPIADRLFDDHLNELHEIAKRMSRGQ